MTTPMSMPLRTGSIASIAPQPAAAGAGQAHNRAARLVGHLPPPRALQPADRVMRVQSPVLQEILRAKQGNPNLISFGGGFPDDELLDFAGMEAAHRRVQEDPVLKKTALAYGSASGYAGLREQVAGLLWAKGVQDIDAENVLITSGSQQAISMVAAARLNEGDRVLVETPTYLTALHSMRLLNGRPVGVPSDKGGMQIDALEKLIAIHRPKFIYLTPTFSNPAGRVMDRERRLALLRLIVQTQTLVVEDSPYDDLHHQEEWLRPESLLSLTSEVEHSEHYVVHLLSLSKVMAPGMRLGAIVARPGLLTQPRGPTNPTGGLLLQAESCRQSVDLHTSTYAQVPAAEYLALGRMPARLAEMRAEYSARKEAMCSALRRHLGDSLEFDPPPGGFFIWGRLTGAGGMETDAWALFKRAAAAGVLVLPGMEFYPEAEEAERSMLRLSFSSVRVEAIEEGVRRLASVMQPPHDAPREPLTALAALSRGLVVA